MDTAYVRISGVAAPFDRKSSDGRMFAAGCFGAFNEVPLRVDHLSHTNAGCCYVRDREDLQFADGTVGRGLLLEGTIFDCGPAMGWATTLVDLALVGLVHGASVLYRPHVEERINGLVVVRQADVLEVSVMTRDERPAFSETRVEFAELQTPAKQRAARQQIQHQLAILKALRGRRSQVAVLPFSW